MQRCTGLHSCGMPHTQGACTCHETYIRGHLVCSRRSPARGAWRCGARVPESLTWQAGLAEAGQGACSGLLLLHPLAAAACLHRVRAAWSLSQEPGWAGWPWPRHQSRAASQTGAALQVSGCGADLSAAKMYYQRYRICEEHLKLSSLLKDNIPQRFCQQCGRFHILSDFDGNKRCAILMPRARPQTSADQHGPAQPWWVEPVRTRLGMPSQELQGAPGPARHWAPPAEGPSAAEGLPTLPRTLPEGGPGRAGAAGRAWTCTTPGAGSGLPGAPGAAQGRRRAATPLSPPPGSACPAPSTAAPTSPTLCPTCQTCASAPCAIMVFFQRSGHASNDCCQPPVCPPPPPQGPAMRLPLALQPWLCTLKQLDCTCAAG